MAAQIFDLSGKVSVVSGAAQGMGRAMSVALAESGSDMAIIDLNESGLSDTASHIRRSEERRVGKECRSRRSPYH